MLFTTTDEDSLLSITPVILDDSVVSTELVVSNGKAVRPTTDDENVWCAENLAGAPGEGEETEDDMRGHGFGGRDDSWSSMTESELSWSLPCQTAGLVSAS